MSSSEIIKSSKRVKNIDLLKAVLVIGMILAHMFRILPRTILFIKVIKYIELISFSGFMFCFRL